MKRMKFLKVKHLYRVAFFSIALLQGLFTYAISVQADNTDVNDILDQVEKRYHLWKPSIQNYGETMNTSSVKEVVPQVNTFFSPSDPKDGQEEIAQASPFYFSGQKESFYFTWYLKRKGCNLTSGGSGTVTLNADQKLCDLDNSGTITINDWKIAAMKNVVNKGFVNEQVSYTTDDDNDGYKAQFGGDKSPSAHCYVHNNDTGLDYELWSGGQSGCAHLFPQPTSGSGTTGDGSFRVTEEKFWHTDPHDPSTAQNGNKDEANVVGLGQDRFIWNYAAGDLVGVVVEGQSMLPTKHADSSMKVMWAFSKNKCEPTGLGGFIYGAPYNGGYAQIPTADMSLEGCLKDNLIDPTQGDQASQLEVQLKTSPDNPVVDYFSPTKLDKGGDVLTVRSSLVNSSTKDTQVAYDWHVYANSKQSQTADDAWEDITQQLIDAHLISAVKGNAISSIKINLNFDESTQASEQAFFTRYFKDDVGYFRINTKAEENFSTGIKRIGRGSVIVKLVRAETRIKTHIVAVDTADWKVKLATPSGTDNGLLCEGTAAERKMCLVVKGQIAGLTFDPTNFNAQIANKQTNSDIAWTLNNKPIRCSDAISKDADCAAGKEVFFPVTGDIGEAYTASMTVTNAMSGKTLTLTRDFRIVDPSVLIVSPDNAKVWPKYLGQYLDTSGATTNNYSQEVFEAFIGSTFSLRGVFYPSSLKNNVNATWEVDGAPATPDADGLVTIDTTKSPGLVHTVSLKGLYIPSPDIKHALYVLWGVSLADVVEKQLSRDVQVELVKTKDVLAAGPLNSSKKFFASIISYVPASVIFFFRLVVTMGLILLVLGITFSFVSEKRKT